MQDYIFTGWTDGGAKINDGAKFRRAGSVPEMLERMQESFTGDVKVIGYEPGDFGDCFAKFTAEPSEDDLRRLSDDYGIPVDAFNVRAPGTHPGGRMWWVDVSITVYVPVFEVTE